MSARQSAAMDKALLYLADGCTVAEAARLAGVSKGSIYRAMARLGIDKPGWKRKNCNKELRGASQLAGAASRSNAGLGEEG